MVKVNLYLYRKGIALERVYDLDFVSAIKHYLGSERPHFRPLLRNVLLERIPNFSTPKEVIVCKMLRTTDNLYICLTKSYD